MYTHLIGINQIIFIKIGYLDNNIHLKIEAHTHTHTYTLLPKHTFYYQKNNNLLRYVL